MDVLKTYKLFIGGKFPRTESGQYSNLLNSSGDHIANICKASRKDFREAVVAARSAFVPWSKRTAYNRGQILYRVAEMLESRKASLIDDLVKCNWEAVQAEKQVDSTINLWVQYAGWADKYQQLHSSVNPVQGPFFNFSQSEPMGVIVHISNATGGILDFSHTILPSLVSGNAIVLISEGELRHTSIELAEVLAVSDVPAGVINILTTEEKETDEHAFSHMDVNAVGLFGVSKERQKSAEFLSVSNLKRIVHQSNSSCIESQLNNIRNFTETRTTWHPNLA